MTDTDSELARLRNEAQRGNAPAWFQLGAALVARQQLEEAFDWYRRAAEVGFAPAQIECARMQLYGVGTTAQPRVALEWLERAEQVGHPGAGYYLALIGIGGVLLPRDIRINDRMLAAAQSDFPPALRAAAIHFGRRRAASDQQLCLQLLERAAQRGDAISALLLAERLAYGEGCAAKPGAAAELRAQLARRGVRPLPRVRVPLPAEAPPHSAPKPETPKLAFVESLQPPALQELSQQPHVMRIDRLLSADECRLLIASAQPLLKRSRTVDPLSGRAMTQEIRTSSDASFDPIVEDFALRVVQVRMARAARVELAQAEQMVVLRYEPGQEYRPHRDYLPPESLQNDHPQAGNRARSICVYLNDVEAGGATEFPLAGLQIAPQAGRAIVFDNLQADGRPDVSSLHAGLPVQRGEKWVATLWLRQGRYRHF